MINLKLNKRVTFFKEVSTRSKTGAVETDTKKLVTLYAEVRQLRGDEKITHGEILDTEIISVVIRFRKTIDNKCQLEWEGSKYNIVHVQELGTKEGLKLLCRKINE